MISKEDLQKFSFYLKRDHLYESNLSGLFNPAFLLLYKDQYDSKFLDGLVFHHEFAHARMTACFYGQLIFCLKIIEIEYYSFLVRRKAAVDYTNRQLAPINKILSHLIKNWINSQEGYAMYCSYYDLEKKQTDESEALLKDFDELLKHNPYYSTGLKQFRRLNSQYKSIFALYLIREIGNLDYLKLWKEKGGDLVDCISGINPDSILFRELEKLVQEKENKTIVIENYKLLNTQGAIRKILAKVTNLNTFIPLLDNRTDRFRYIFDFFLDRLGLEDEFVEEVLLQIEGFQKRDVKLKPVLFDVSTVEAKVLCFQVEMNNGKVDFVKNKIEHVEEEVNRLIILNRLLDLERKTKKRKVAEEEQSYFAKLKALPKLCKYIFPLDFLDYSVQQITIRCRIEKYREFLVFFKSKTGQGVSVDEERLWGEKEKTKLFTLELFVTIASKSSIDFIKHQVLNDKDQSIEVFIDNQKLEFPKDLNRLDLIANSAAK